MNCYIECCTLWCYMSSLQDLKGITLNLVYGTFSMRGDNTKYVPECVQPSP